MIDVSGLKKSYKANHVLKDVSFTVRKNPFYIDEVGQRQSNH